MRISDWSSDVCSSDLGTPTAPSGVTATRHPQPDQHHEPCTQPHRLGVGSPADRPIVWTWEFATTPIRLPPTRWRRLLLTDRKSVVSGTRVSVSVDLGVRRSIKKKKKTSKTNKP